MNKLDRIKIFTNHLIVNKLVDSQKELGAAIGYSNESSISQILTGKVKLPENFIKKLKSFLPELNADWIETGNGSMLIDKTMSSQQSHDIISMPADVWAVISSQAESLKSKDRQIDIALAQTSEMLELLKEQLKKGLNATTRLRAANLVVEEDE